MQSKPTFEPRPAPDMPDGLVIFDGECVLCSAWVRFVIPRDLHGTFRFASIQGQPGRELALRLGIDPDNPATNAVILDAVAYFKSDAALAVLTRIHGWGWTRMFRRFPRIFRDWIYDRIARNRYALFGRTEQCMVPDKDLSARFLSLPPPQ